MNDDSKDHHHQPFPEEDEGKASPQPTSYTMVEPRFREIYFQFYKETYKPSALDRKTKELVAIGASLAAKCQGCLEGHIKKALKFGASREEVSEAIAIAQDVVNNYHDVTWSYRHLAAWSAMTGDIETARWAAQKLLAAEPGFTIERYRALPWFQRIPQWQHQMAEALRQAGLPER